MARSEGVNNAPHFRCCPRRQLLHVGPQRLRKPVRGFQSSRGGKRLSLGTASISLRARLLTGDPRLRPRTVPCRPWAVYARNGNGDHILRGYWCITPAAMVLHRMLTHRKVSLSADPRMAAGRCPNLVDDRTPDRFHALVSDSLDGMVLRQGIMRRSYPIFVA